MSNKGTVSSFDRRGRLRSKWLALGGLRSKFRKRLFGLMAFLPKFLRFYFIRRISLNNINLPKGSVIKLAETKEEFAQAFRIQYEQYRYLGYIDENEFGMTYSLFHSLPSTRVIIVKIKNEVVGTMSLFTDSPMGLPMEAGWDISQCRSEGVRVAEIGALCIKRGRPGLKGKLFIPMCIFVYRYARKYLGVDRFVIGTRKEVKEYYQAVFGFKLLSNPFLKYSSVKGNESVGQYLDLVTFENKLLSDSEKYKKTGDLAFVMESLFLPQLKLPVNIVEAMRSQAMQGDLERTFFGSGDFQYLGFSEEALLALMNMKGADSSVVNTFMEKVSINRDKIFAKARSSIRWQVKIPVSIYSMDSGLFLRNGFLFDVGQMGGKIFSEDFEFNESSYAIMFNVPGFGEFRFAAELAWRRGSLAGVSLHSFDEKRWVSFVSYIAGDNRNILNSKKSA